MLSDNLYTEKQLIRELQMGDAAAFSQIYAMFAQGLIRYVFGKSGDLEQAQDIVHDIFTKLWDRREQLEIDHSLGAYLYKQALNQCLNDFRHKKVVEAHLLRSLADYLENFSVDAADQHLLDREIAGSVQEQLERLAPKMRETLEMRLHFGYSNREIAQRMDVSEHTVATQIKRALRLLRARLRYMSLWILLFLNVFNV